MMVPDGFYVPAWAPSDDQRSAPSPLSESTSCWLQVSFTPCNASADITFVPAATRHLRLETRRSTTVPNMAVGSRSFWTQQYQHQFNTSGAAPSEDTL